jgi:SAM-dependent methyltransferase
MVSALTRLRDLRGSRHPPPLPFTAHRVQLRDGSWTMEQGDDPLLSLRTKALLDRLGGSLEGRRVLDLGCLEGGYTVAFAQLGAKRSVGLEVRPENLVRCRFLKRNLKLRNVRFVKGDVRNLSPAAHGRFDVVFASGILYHLEDPFDLISRTAAVCTELALIDTHVAVAGSTAHGLTGELETREHAGHTYRGATVPEHETGISWEEMESFQWSSWGNWSSFWLEQESLVRLLGDVGFSDVSKVPVPLPYYCEESCKEECRVLLLASRG